MATINLQTGGYTDSTDLSITSATLKVSKNLKTGQPNNFLIVAFSNGMIERVRITRRAFDALARTQWRVDHKVIHAGNGPK